MAKSRLILDCSALLPGPFVGKLLANQGCRVLKVESPERPDPARGMGAVYDDLNGCKELVSLSIAPTHADRAQFEKLVREADGLIEGFRPTAKKKLGLDFEVLHALNPKLCVASLVGYPSDSPQRNRAGHDLNFQAVTGCLSLFREMPALPLADLFAAYEAALGLMSAMDAVTRGQSAGRCVEISMSKALLGVQSMLIREFKESQKEPLYGETLFSGQYPAYREYKAACGRRIAVGAIEPKFWMQVCTILGVPELSEDGMTTGERGKAVAAATQRAFSSKTWAEWAPSFEKADCCVEPVLTYPEAHGV